MKRAVCLQQVPFEGPGVFRPLLEQAGYHVHTIIVPTDGLPADSGDFLLIMGGPMSVNDSDEWIDCERRFVRKALDQNIPVVGICFGAQLLARALGGRVAPGPVFEIGMVHISLTGQGAQDPVFRGMTHPFPVFQWHGEGITLPPDTVHLASSADFPVQAFKHGHGTYGLLFHPEIEAHGIQALCRQCPQDVQRGGVTPEFIESHSRQHLAELHQIAERLIRHLTG